MSISLGLNPELLTSVERILFDKALLSLLTLNVDGGRTASFFACIVFHNIIKSMSKMLTKQNAPVPVVFMLFLTKEMMSVHNTQS